MAQALVHLHMPLPLSALALHQVCCWLLTAPIAPAAALL